jgi:hypothetical protein
MLAGMAATAGLAGLESDVSRRRREAARLLLVASARCRWAAVALSGPASPAAAAATAREAAADLAELAALLHRLSVQARRAQARNVPQRGTI